MTKRKTTDTYTQNVEKGVESVRSSLVVQLDLPSEGGGLVKPLHTSVQKLSFLGTLKISKCFCDEQSHGLGVQKKNILPNKNDENSDDLGLGGPVVQKNSVFDKKRYTVIPPSFAHVPVAFGAAEGLCSSRTRERI